MSAWLVGVHTSSKSWDRCVTCAVPPVGSIKTSLDGVLVVRKGSWRVPAIDIAPVSLIAEGMKPLVMLCLTWFLVMLAVLCLALCLVVGEVLERYNG